MRCSVNLSYILQEALLTQKDIGDSLDAVLTSKRKHDDFSKSATAQEEKINSVDEVATKLIVSGHYAADDIQKRRNEVIILSVEGRIAVFGSRHSGDLAVFSLFIELLMELD